MTNYLHEKEEKKNMILPSGVVVHGSSPNVENFGNPRSLGSVLMIIELILVMHVTSPTTDGLILQLNILQ